jgi:ankyrin repeat protein
MSVKDYLLSHGLRDDGSYIINEKLAHSFIGQSCMAYFLQFDRLPPLPVNIQKFPLAEYAENFWASHINSGNEEYSEIQQRLISAFFQPDGAPITVCLKIYEERFWPKCPLIAYASTCCVPQAVQLLLDKGFDITGEDGAEALQHACRNGHEATVRLLLEKGAAPQSENAIPAACYRGKESIMKLLLEFGLTQKGLNEALSHAIRRQNESLVKLLLENGADANTREEGDIDRPVLCIASSSSNRRIVELLLDYGANINGTGFYGNALYDASYNGQENIVKLLLKNGINIHAGGTLGNALQAASAKGHEEVVKLLLEKSANVNTQGGQYKTALQAALVHGHKSIVKLWNRAVDTVVTKHNSD